MCIFLYIYYNWKLLFSCNFVVHMETWLALWWTCWHITQVIYCIQLKPMINFFISWRCWIQAPCWLISDFLLFEKSLVYFLTAFATLNCSLKSNKKIPAHSLWDTCILTWLIFLQHKNLSVQNGFICIESENSYSWKGP